MGEIENNLPTRLSFCFEFWLETTTLRMVEPGEGVVSRPSFTPLWKEFVLEGLGWLY